VLKPSDVLGTLLARVDALEAHLAYVPQAMADEAARIAAIQAQLMTGHRVTPGDLDLLLRTASSDTERQYWTLAQASAV